MRKINIQTSFQPALKFLFPLKKKKSVITSSSEELDLLHYYYLFLLFATWSSHPKKKTGLELNMSYINLHRTLCSPDLQESPDSGGGKGDWEKHDPFLHSKT